MPSSILRPKIVDVLREGYRFNDFTRDLTGGVVTGIVAIPLAIAFAIASGVRPEQGLFTAVIAGFLISLLSGSRVQIGGPTGAFIVIIAGVMSKFGYEGLALATIMAGIMLVLFGVFRLGAAIKYIPYPVTVGFTSGIALIILVSQLKDFAGLRMESVPAEFLPKMAAYIGHIATVSWPSVLIGVLSAAVIFLMPRFTSKVPGSIVAIVIFTAVVKLFNLDVATIGSSFPPLPQMLPAPRLPFFSVELALKVLPSAFTIALLAGIESLLSAVVADGMTGRRHRSNMELVGQGVANIVTPFFLGIPATGAIARTATNIRNGGRTPIAGIVHALVVMLCMLIFAPFVSLIPMPVLAAILIVTAVNMSEYRLFLSIFKGPRSDILVLLTTFLLTVLVDLTRAIEVGIIMAALLFMVRMSNLSSMDKVTGDYEEDSDNTPDIPTGPEVPKRVMVYEIRGSFFFGVADKFKDTLRQTGVLPRALVLQMKDVFFMDMTGIKALEDLFEKTRREKTALIITGIHAQPLYALRQYGLYQRIGEDRIYKGLPEAMEKAAELAGSRPAGKNDANAPA